MSFEKYLQQNKLKASTIKGHLQDVSRFKKWCESKSIHYDQATYNELLTFIRETRSRGVGKSSVNIHLTSISKYYDYLIQLGKRNENPAKELRLKNSGKKVIQYVLTPQELEEIYTSYAGKPSWSFSKGEKSKQIHLRNMVIIGLLIYQGITIPELRKLEKSHLNLLQGTIYIPAASRSNSRILKLNARQIIPMQQYLQDLGSNNEILFPEAIRNIIFFMMTGLKKTNEKIRNVQQIRGSVIINWLKQYNIRQVQYMAGHRYISSTEHFKQEDLRDLQTQLNLFHPFK